MQLTGPVGQDDRLGGQEDKRQAYQEGHEMQARKRWHGMRRPRDVKEGH